MNPKSENDISPPLPHNPDAERAVLGAILGASKSHDVAFDLLQPKDFFLDQIRKIFEAAVELRAHGKPTDLLMVEEELRRTGKLEAAGGVGYLAQLGDEAHKLTNVEYYARIVKEKALLRRLIHQTDAIQQQAFEAEEDAEAILDRAANAVSELACDLKTDRDEGASYRDAASRLIQSFDSSDALRIFTDVEKLDAVTGGFRAGELVLFTAETGTGKTLLGQQTRRRACRDGHHSLFCSGEMHAPHLVSRELASQARVAAWKMRRPERITRDERSALVGAASRECMRCKILDGELSLRRIRRAARQMKARTGVDLVILDYDELIEAPGRDEFDQQRALARGAKSLAIELSCPVILVSQLRKPLGGEDAKRPTLSRLYGSAAKCKHASIVVYVDREFVRELRGAETVARIVVLKNRDGRVGRIEAKFNIDTLRFESPAGEDIGVRPVPNAREILEGKLPYKD